MMQTDKLIALMIMAALIGYLIDRILQMVTRNFTRWRFVQ